MRIAILSCFYPYRGGISQFNAALLEELGRQGNQVKAFNFTRQYPEFLFPGKTQYVTADDPAAKVHSTPVLDTVNPLSYCKTYRAIKAWGPDLVIVRYWMSWFAPSLGFVTRRLKKDGIKVISILDNVIPHEAHWFDRPLTRYFLGGSSGAVTLCEAVSEDLASINSKLKRTVIPHPLYTHFGTAQPREEALRKLGLDPKRKTLLFFGLIRRYKGLDILLEAFSKLDDSYQLIIAGEPYGSFDEYGRQIQAIPSAPERIVSHLAYIKDSEVADFFSGADLCVLPYRSATQSGVSAIAFHFEVPMLVTDTGGLKESIADTGTGLLAEQCTAQAVADGINAFFADPEISAGCKKNIRKQKDILSWERFARNLQDFAKKI